MCDNELYKENTQWLPNQYHAQTGVISWVFNNENQNFLFKSQNRFAFSIQNL